MPAEMVCMASGPSLTHEDAELVCQWRQADPERKVIVVNTTYQIAPWADYLFAMDEKWWKVHKAEVERTFKGEGLTSSARANLFGVKPACYVVKKYNHYGNSGAAALSLAIALGASRIYLLGYDAQRTHAKAHWHGDHPKGLGNAASMPKWPEQFNKLKGAFPDAKVINCSRHTALTMFPRMRLEDALRIVPETAGSVTETFAEAA